MLQPTSPAAGGDDDRTVDDDDPEPSPSAFDAAEPSVRPTPLEAEELALEDREVVVGGAGTRETAGGSTRGVLTDAGSGAPPPGTLAGIGLILILGTSAGLVAIRRRNASA